MDPNIIEELFKLILAVMLSSCIGFERELRQKGAGLRTHILVAVGSTLFTLTALHLATEFSTITTMDPSRLITGIVTGVGFICAGTIIRAGSSVHGLTTAASLWIVSGIGIAIGCGYYSGGILTTITAILVLIGIHPLEKQILKLAPQKR